MPTPRHPLSLATLRQLAPDALEQALADAQAKGVRCHGKLFVCFDLHAPPGPSLAVETLVADGRDVEEAVAEVQTRLTSDAQAGETSCAASFLEPERFIAILETIVLPVGAGAALLEEVRAFALTPLSSGAFPLALIAGTDVQLDVLRVRADRRLN